MKKGFTLIELLAVIVILAVIALIATPIVLSIVRDSKQAALLRTAEMYMSGLNNSIATEMFKDKTFKINDGTYRITDKGKVCIGEYENKVCTGTELNVEIDKNKPTDGIVEIENKTAKNYYFIIDNKTITNLNSTPHFCFETKENEDGTLKITNYLCSRGDFIITDVVIPNKINDKDVTIIGRSSFMWPWSNNVKHLTSVVIPSGITTIESDAFRNNYLTEIVIPDSVKKIESNAFESNRLTKINIPQTVSNIGNAIFNSNMLSNDEAFIYARNEDGTEDRSRLVSYGGKNKYVTIPNNVVTIGAYAFQNCELTNVKIPESVKTIEFGAFATNNLTSISIPNTVTSISGLSFNNNKLSDDQAFIYARNADGTEDRTYLVSYGGAKKDVVIPNGVTRICSYALFFNQLTSVILPETLTIIESAAFSNNKLTEIIIPESVKKIYRDAFSENKLETVTIKGKDSLSDFEHYEKAFGWASGYSDQNIKWEA